MYKDIILEAVENGYILRCREMVKEGNGTYDMAMPKSREFVYQDNQLDEAVKKMKEMKEKSKKEKKEHY